MEQDSTKGDSQCVTLVGSMNLDEGLDAGLDVVTDAGLDAGLDAITATSNPMAV